MKKLLLIIICLISSQVILAQKSKLIEGSLMIFSDCKSKIGIGAVSTPFLKLNVTKKLSIGTALAPILWFDTKKSMHSMGSAGFAIRADYKKVSVGINLLTIAGVDNKFIGIGFKL
jgi:hypothetical protein